VPSSLDRIVRYAGEAFTPFADALIASDEDAIALVQDLGWELPSLPPSLAALRSTVGDLISSLADTESGLREHAEGTLSETDLLSRLARVGANMAIVASQIAGLGAKLKTELGASYANATGIDAHFADRLLQYLLHRGIEERTPRLAAMLSLLGVLETEYLPPDPVKSQPETRLRRVRLERIPTFIQDPAKVVKDVYGWGTPSLDADRLFWALSWVSREIAAPARVVYPSEELVAALAPGVAIADDEGPDPMLAVPVFFTANVSLEALVYPVPKAAPSDLQAIAVTLVAAGGIAQTYPLSQRVSLALETGASLSSGVALILRPDQGLSLKTDALTKNPGSLASGKIAGTLAYGPTPGESAFPIITIAGDTRVQAKELRLGAGAEALPGPKTDAYVEASVVEGKLVIAAGDLDTFLAKLLPPDGMEAPFEVGISWSHSRGLAFSGSGGLELKLPLNLKLAIVELKTLYVAALARTDHVDLELSLSGDVTIGPVAATIERVGARAALSLRAGNLGPVGLEVGFQPPTGLGIAVDAGPVVGGGFISFDPDKGRYTGVLQLAVASIQIKAIGILDTKLPGGQSGYSFLIIVSAEFPPIQLGFGFTLNGVGGLAGIQRTMVTEALQAGIRSHAVDHILFPKDPVANAPQIVSDLQAFFPPAPGRYVFGPMAILAYGSGPATLVEAELGVLLELPAPIRLVLLGQISAHLPSKEAAVAELHLDLIGVLEFAKRTVSIDATLHDSRLVKFPLTGDMALRLSYGDQPAFAFALGGFNPRFTPPPGFPALDRLTLTLAKDGGNPTIVCQSYLALTSNTAQFGARAEISASELGFSIRGWLGFDVLVVISPFSLLADLQAAVEVKRGAVKIASASLTGQLSGPTPWHLAGRASFDFIVHYEVPVEATIGEAVTAALPAADPWLELQAALQDTRSWRSVPGPAAAGVVSQRALPEGAEPLLDPLGGAAVHEKACPLNRRLTKFGEAEIEGAGGYDLGQDAVTVGGAPVEHRTVQDYFAAAQFEQLSDAERLSRPGFERMDSGFELESDALALGASLGDTVGLETVIVDDPGYAPPPYELSAEAQGAALATSASSRGGLGAVGEERFAPPPGQRPPVSLAEERFVIVDSSTLKRPSPDPSPKDGTAGKGAAVQALEAYLRSHPERRGQAAVVPAPEAA
jgi:hypothetical protein